MRTDDSLAASKGDRVIDQASESKSDGFRRVKQFDWSGGQCLYRQPDDEYQHATDGRVSLPRNGVATLSVHTE